MPVGRADLVAFTMMPISVVLKPGHRIRLSIAGADAAAFASVPADGPPPLYAFERGGGRRTRLLLPTAGDILLSPAINTAGETR